MCSAPTGSWAEWDALDSRLPDDRELGAGVGEGDAHVCQLGFVVSETLMAPVRTPSCIVT